MAPVFSHLMEIEMAKSKTSEEPDEAPVVEPVAPKKVSEWPEIALVKGDDGKTLEPGDEGYPAVPAYRQIRKAIAEAKDKLTELRDLHSRVQKAVAENAPPPLSSHEAVRASLANEKRARERRDEQKQQLADRLNEMGLLPE